MSETPSFDSKIKAVEWRNEGCRLLDQRQLPHHVEYLEYQTAEGVAQAIQDMVVRGAPAIGITAAYGVVLAARTAYLQAAENWKQAIQTDMEKLNQSRPTAINLHWAINQMHCVIESLATDKDPVERLLVEAIKIHNQDIAANRTMGDLAADVIGHANGVMTHCNAGALATGGYGTALGVIRSLYGRGKLSQVYAGETRPWLQGARLTAWELAQDNIPVCLVADSAASYLFSQGKVDWVIVGSDRIAANGDVANKIGTYQLAITARYHGVKFMVAAPLSTIDLNTASGNNIPLEQRQQSEVLSFAKQTIAPQDVAAINPVFDITPADLIDVIVTEKGVIEQPDTAKIASLFQ